ncbi:LysR substrate-binding domain-containing protein [Amycolatopsis sp. NPDC098790]|uniref:LysR substrate-binding domain-containing protein n=1 Tax=Amycolatopsis sp. NPDC098790 TaxID=3363939 RepID=UPI00382999CC
MTSFRLAYVPGATPAKWVRTWGERQPDVPLELVPVAAADAAELIRSRGADAALLRSPIDRDGLHAIPLYTETTVVVVPKDHLIAAADEVSTADLVDDVVLHPLDDTIEWAALPGRPAVSRPESTADAVELVAAGVGVLVVPQSLARLHHRRDLTYRTVADAPQSSVALSWLEDETTDLMEAFIGVVRGRTVNSTRGRQQPPAPEKKRPERKPAAPKKPAARRTGGGAPKRGKPRRRS